MAKDKNHLICFDLDGVLISSMVTANQIFYEVAERELDLPLYDYPERKELMALSVEDRMRNLWKKEIQEKGITEDQIKHALQIFREEKMAAEIPMLPHAKEAVERMAAAFEFLACVSSNTQDVIQKTLADLGLLHYFSKVTGVDYIDFSKPHPEIYMTTIGYFGFEPKDCLAIEDSTHGIQSAKGAGMKVVGVATGLETIEELKKTPADSLIPDLSVLNLSLANELLEI